MSRQPEAAVLSDSDEVTVVEDVVELVPFNHWTDARAYNKVFKACQPCYVKKIGGTAKQRQGAQPLGGTQGGQHGHDQSVFVRRQRSRVAEVGTRADRDEDSCKSGEGVLGGGTTRERLRPREYCPRLAVGGHGIRGGWSAWRETATQQRSRFRSPPRHLSISPSLSHSMSS